jgi:hypothetical protein
MDFPYGAMIGVVDLVDVVPLSSRLEKDPWASGPYCWKLENARRFERPIPAKGMLNLYTLKGGDAAKARAAVESSVGASRDARAEAWIQAMCALDEPADRIEGLFHSYLDLDDEAGMLRTAERLVKLRPDATAFAHRAMAKRCHEDARGAIADATRALELDPKSVMALFVRRWAYHELGNDKAAARDEATLRAINPEAAKRLPPLRSR